MSCLMKSKPYKMVKESVLMHFESQLTEAQAQVKSHEKCFHFMCVLSYIGFI